MLMLGMVIGTGEVGTALYDILSETYPISKYDISDGDMPDKNIDILHICFPWSDSFIGSVEKYQKKYTPKHTVIHSTVPVGTSDSLGATHSPIRGMHPHMKEGILKFVKFVGGCGADEVADYFRRAGIKVKVCRASQTTEMAKLISTLYYGVCIEFVKDAECLCIDAGVPFSEAFTLWQQTYNDGYAKLNRPEYMRPVLEPIQHKIGGHCVLPNALLLKSKFSDMVK